MKPNSLVTHSVLSGPAQVVREQDRRPNGEGLDDEVAVGGRVHGVLGDASEA